MVECIVRDCFIFIFIVKSGINLIYIYICKCLEDL